MTTHNLTDTVHAQGELSIVYGGLGVVRGDGYVKEPEQPDVAELLARKHLPGTRLKPLSQKTIPRLAKDPAALGAISRAVREFPTRHRMWLGDARTMAHMADESVHLVVTSPPYFDLKRYPDHHAQLGDLHDYEIFIKELGRVWAQCHRVLVKGGRLIIVVGDVCRSRREYGEHQVIPLHASIAESCRELGFNNLATLVWHKISNAKFEVENGTAFLGKPYEPNAVINPTSTLSGPDS